MYRLVALPPSQLNGKRNMATRRKPEIQPIAGAAGSEEVWIKVLQVLGPMLSDRTSRKKLDSFRELVRGASTHGAEVNGPVREVLALVGDRWSAMLLQLAHHGPFRFSMMQKLIGIIIGTEISRRILAHKLQALERDGLVMRKVTPTSPPQVEYALTDMGEELWAIVAHLVDWLTLNEESIRLARAAFTQQLSDKQSSDH